MIDKDSLIIKYTSNLGTGLGLNVAPEKKKRVEFEIKSVISVTELFLSLNHIFIICVCLVAQSYLTLHDPVDYSPLGASVRGIFLPRILEWVAITCFKGFSRPKD